MKPVRYAIECEKVGPNGYLIRLMQGKRVRTFATREEAQAFADRIELQAHTSSAGKDTRMRFEVVEFPDHPRPSLAVIRKTHTVKGMGK